MIIITSRRTDGRTKGDKRRRMGRSGKLIHNRSVALDCQVQVLEEVRLLAALSVWLVRVEREGRRLGQKAMMSEEGPKN